MQITYAKQPIKIIGGIDKPTKQRMKKAIEALPKGDVKPLKGNTSLYRLRDGSWRIIFSFPDDDTILIEKIAPRGDVYKGGLPL